MQLVGTFQNKTWSLLLPRHCNLKRHSTLSKGSSFASDESCMNEVSIPSEHVACSEAGDACDSNERGRSLRFLVQGVEKRKFWNMFFLIYHFPSCWCKLNTPAFLCIGTLHSWAHPDSSDSMGRDTMSMMFNVYSFLAISADVQKGCKHRCEIVWLATIVVIISRCRWSFPVGSRAIAMHLEAPSRRALLRRRARARAAKKRKIRALQRLFLACRVMIAIRRWRRKTFEVDPFTIKRSNSEATEVQLKEDSGLEIAVYEESDIYEDGDIYEDILNQFQSLLRGMPLEWPQSRAEMMHRALHFAIAEREALSLELTRLRWEVLVVKLLWWSKEFVVGMRWLRPFRGRSWTVQSICYSRGILHGKHFAEISEPETRHTVLYTSWSGLYCIVIGPTMYRLHGPPTENAVFVVVWSPSWVLRISKYVKACKAHGSQAPQFAEEICDI